MVRESNQRVAPSDRTRRLVLASVGTVLTAGLAGCGGSGDGGETTTGTTGGDETSGGEPTGTNSGETTGTNAVASVNFLPAEQSVEIQFAAPDEVAEVQIQRPDGETIEDTAFDGERVTVSVQLYDQEMIPGGTYTVVSEFDGEETGSATFEVEKSLRISALQTTGGDQYPSFVVTLENDGDVAIGPDLVELSGSISETTSIVGRATLTEAIGIGATEEITVPFNSDVKGAPGNDGYAFDGERGCNESGPITVTAKQSMATGDEVLDTLNATVAVGGDAVDEAHDKYACSTIAVESTSEPS